MSIGPATSRCSVPQFIELKIDSDPANLARVRHEVEQLSSACGFDPAAVGEIGLCVNEALANVIRHAYSGAIDRPIEIAARVVDGQITIIIRDWGNGVNPAEVLPAQPDPMTPGGLGLICLAKMMDETVFTAQPDGMLLTMTRRTHRDAA